MTGIAGVLFDKDGTLLDFDATWGPATAAVIDVLAGGDPGCRADLARSCGFVEEPAGFAPGSPIIAGALDDFAPAWAARIGAAWNADFAHRVDALYRAASLRSLTAYADVVPLLDLLRKEGIAAGVATNDSEATARAHLSALGIASRFAFVAGYDSGYGAKPLPGMAVAFAAHLGVSTARIVMVGDSGHDMDCALAAGARAIAIARTAAAQEALAGFAGARIGSFAAFEAVLSGDRPAALAIS